MKGVSPKQNGSDGASSGPRVLIMAPQPFFTDRGTPIATRHLLEALSELGYRTDVLTYALGRPVEIPGVRLIRIPDPLHLRAVPIGFSLRKCWLDLFFFASLTRCLRQNEYACVSAVEEAAFVAALAAPRFGVPVIYDMQSSLADHMARLAPFRNRFASNVFERSERWLFEHVDLIMTSAGLAERVRAASPGASVREWQYPGVSEGALQSDIDHLRQQLGLEATDPVVLYSGTFADYQGLSELLEAMPTVLERMSDTVLVLVGAQDGAADRAVRNLSRRLPARAVRILERQPHESMPRFLALANVVVSPRRYGENLPIKVLEYLAAGKAIVATDIPAHRTVLDNERAQLVGPSAESLAAGISELLTDDERRATLEGEARAFAQRHLGWLGFVHSVGEAFKAVCADGPAG